MVRLRISFNLARTAGVLLIILGTLALASSIIYVSPIPALIGLGLIFWGIILTYIQTGEYVKETVLDATTASMLITLNQTMQELDYRGKTVYLPPKYLNDPESTKAYVSRQTRRRAEHRRTALAIRDGHGRILATHKNLECNRNAHLP